MASISCEHGCEDDTDGIACWAWIWTGPGWIDMGKEEVGYQRRGELDIQGRKEQDDRRGCQEQFGERMKMLVGSKQMLFK